MKNKFSLASLILLLTFTTNPAYGEDEIYYCAETDTNGFYYSEERSSYKRTGFASGKFKMKFDRGLNLLELAIDTESESLRMQKYTCKDLFLKGELFCSGQIYSFNFNANNGRFVYMKGAGYVNGDGDSISISYGKCDKF